MLRILSFTLLLGFVFTTATAQSSKTKVMTLGSFHFNFPNLDVKRTSKNDQIDVLEERFKKEIQDIVKKISKFKPTIIVIERQPARQHFTDSVFNSYLSGNYTLKRNEE